MGFRRKRSILQTDVSFVIFDKHLRQDCSAVSAACGTSTYESVINHENIITTAQLNTSQIPNILNKAPTNAY